MWELQGDNVIPDWLGYTLVGLVVLGIATGATLAIVTLIRRRRRG